MSFFPLPPVRMPIQACSGKADAPLINASLREYLAKLPAHASQYVTLSGVCNYPGHPSFFKMLELLQVLALPPTPLRIMHLGSPNTPALLHLRGDLDQHVVDAAARSVDLLISDAGLHGALRTACRVQALGGTLVAAVGDLTGRAAAQLVYVMAALYGKVVVYSPVLFAEEKYLVGSDFKGGEVCEAPPPYDFAMSLYFLTRLEEVNSVCGQGEMDYARSDAKPDQGCAEWRENYFKSVLTKC